MADEPSQYERGVAAGEIAARLRGHDEHLAAINGSMADVARQLKALVLEVQWLADAAEADRRTVVTTAKALKDASDAGWSPWARAGAMLAALAATGGAIAAIIASHH